MISMLDRIADAMTAVPPHVSENHRESMKRLARVAIIAMLDVDDSVAREVGRAAWHSGSGQSGANVWRAGVQAILDSHP